MPVCPACKTDGPAGRFCSHCGAIREKSTCVRCGTALAAATRFCQQCGTPVASPTLFAPVPGVQQRPDNRIPWIIGGVAAVALIAVVVAQAGRDGGAAPSQPLAPFSGAPAASAATTDISQMTPQERASRLYDRIMRLDEEGKADSVQLFASMAIPTFQSLAPLDNHMRYDLGRVAAAAGELDLAQAQADSILRQRPQHLLGLILAARVAERRGDNAAAARYRSRLVSGEANERAASLEEYRLHDADIRAAVTAARERS